MPLKVLFDNNLSVKLPQAVSEFFPDSKHVTELKIERFTDQEIFKFAGKNQFVIVTKDRDFYHLLNTFGPPPKIVWLSVGNCRNNKVVETIKGHAKQIQEFIKSNRSLFVIS